MANQKEKRMEHQMSTEFYRGVYAVGFPKVRDLLFWGSPAWGLWYLEVSCGVPLFREIIKTRSCVVGSGPVIETILGVLM